MTSIEWTHVPGYGGETWNPVVGCSVVSPGCTNCYAMAQAYRIKKMSEKREGRIPAHYFGTTQIVNGRKVWTGKVASAPDHIWQKPLKRQKPTCWFVNSMGDLFHEAVPNEWIDRAFAVMALTPQHIYIVLTKRSSRMRLYLSDPDTIKRVYDLVCDMAVNEVSNIALMTSGIDPSLAPPGRPVWLGHWPLPNVWIGVSAEDQPRADERIADLLATPAAVRLVSAEPLLSPIDFETAWHDETAMDAECWGDCRWCSNGHPPLHNCQKGLQSEPTFFNGRSGLDWIIVGGESGHGRRPFDPDWARSIRDQCAAAGVPFFMKQWDKHREVPADLMIRQWPEVACSAR